MKWKLAAVGVGADAIDRSVAVTGGTDVDVAVGTAVDRSTASCTDVAVDRSTALNALL